MLSDRSTQTRPKVATILLKQVVRLGKACANCLFAGHSANFCLKKRFIRVTGCKGKHSSYLHTRGQGAAPVNIVSNSATIEAQVQIRNRENGRTVFSGYVKEKKENRSKQQEVISL